MQVNLLNRLMLKYKDFEFNASNSQCHSEKGLEAVVRTAEETTDPQNNREALQKTTFLVQNCYGLFEQTFNSSPTVIK